MFKKHPKHAPTPEELQLAKEEAEADAYGEKIIKADKLLADDAATVEAAIEPDRFYSGGATAEEIACHRAAHAK